MEEKFMPISKVVEGLKKYMVTLIGVMDTRGIITAFFINSILDNRAADMLNELADSKGEINIDAVKRNALEALDKLPGQTYSVSLPAVGMLTLNKKAVDDIYKIIAQGGTK